MERIFQLIGNANVLRLGGTIQPSTETRGKQFYKTCYHCHSFEFISDMTYLKNPQPTGISQYLRKIRLITI
jgi:hypothetical protein